MGNGSLQVSIETHRALFSAVRVNTKGIKFSLILSPVLPSFKVSRILQYDVLCQSVPVLLMKLGKAIHSLADIIQDIRVF